MFIKRAEKIGHVFNVLRQIIALNNFIFSTNEYIAPSKHQMWDIMLKNVV